MKMIDLKRAKPKKEKDTEKDSPQTLVGPSYDERPYCLRFTLEKPELEKLGLTPQSFSGMVPVTATIEIEPITIRDIETKDNHGDTSCCSVEFQIKKISIEGTEDKESSKFKDYDDAQEEGPGGKEVK